MLSQWFFGSTGPEDRSLSTSKRLFVFSLLLVLTYGASWSLFSLVQPAYHKALTIGTEACYDLTGRPITLRREGDTTIFRCFASPAFEADFSTRPLVSNWPFLLALLLAVPGLHPRRRLALVVIGLSILYACHIAFQITKVEAAIVSVNHPMAGSPALWQSLDNFFEVYGKTFFPMLIWLGLVMPYMLGKVDPRTPVKLDRQTSRNAPCPCGSGKKFKRCCGRN